jgi:polyisoprenoid-binding protein YceI
MAATVVLGVVAASGHHAGAENPPAEWNIVPTESRVTISVFPAGLLSGTLHTHLFRPDSWSGRIAWTPDEPARVKVEVRFAADSLKDRQEKLSASDIAKVEAQVRSTRILDAATFPEVAFEAKQLEAAELPAGGSGEFRARLAGTLTLHGISKPLRFPIQGRVSESRLDARGTAVFKQSDFGVKPYSTALGSIAVKDEVSVEIELVAAPGRSAAK